MSNYPDGFNGTNMDEPRDKPEREYEKPDLTEAEIAMCERPIVIDWTKNPSKEQMAKDISAIFGKLGE